MTYLSETSRKFINQLNEELLEAGLPPGLTGLTVDVDSLGCTDPELSLDVLLCYESKRRRWFHVMAYDAVAAYFAPARPVPVVFGLPIIIVESITAVGILESVLRYLTLEENMAEECIMPDGLTYGGVNREIQQLYHLGLSSCNLEESNETAENI